MTFLKKRGQHKGENGRVLIIGGSLDLVGAPALAAMAALRTGVDLSVVAAPKKTAWAINNYSPDLITKKFEGEFFNWDNVKEVIEYAENFHVILIGPGLGTEPSTFDFIKEIIEHLPQPKVIDADALKSLKDVKIHNAVLTPHKKEFEIMTDEILPEDVAKQSSIVKHFAQKNIIITLKGKTDIISDGDRIHHNISGNNGMTVGGTGDVLAGITAGFIAQSGDLFNSAVAATLITGKIGDHLLKQKGVGFTASDFLPLISEFIKKNKI